MKMQITVTIYGPSFIYHMGQQFINALQGLTDSVKIDGNITSNKTVVTPQDKAIELKGVQLSFSITRHSFFQSLFVPWLKKWCNQKNLNASYYTTEITECGQISVE